MESPDLLTIAIGNTRIKAAIFNSNFQLIKEYAVNHQDLPILEMELGTRGFKWIAIASVVPNLITTWHNRENAQIISTGDVPLKGLYASMGCDRALAAFGAGECYGYPILVIDAGTAITLTGIDGNKNFVGGAIMAGLRSQFISLHANTAALPHLSIPEVLPPRWGKDTVSSIQTGISQILLAGLQVYIDDWRSLFPDSKVIITGGDGDRFQGWGLAVDAIDQYLIFLGMLKVFQGKRGKGKRKNYVGDRF
jgi:type III pantothenate kinase